MSLRLLLAADDALPPETLNTCVELCSSLATVIGEPIYLATLDGDSLNELEAWLSSRVEGGDLEGLAPRTVSNAPMAAAPFLYREDGRPDWASMWEGFCELALYGGPPHRGADNPVEAEQTESDSMVMGDAITEIRRGIFETTGLFSEPSPPNWMAVTCHSKRMAAWMCAAIILENVDARCEDEILYVPASSDFELTNQIKSVITVVAKVNHYWQAHVAEQTALQAPS